MPASKTVAMTFRVTPEFKRLLETAAGIEQRSNTNMLEKLLHDHCVGAGLLEQCARLPNTAAESKTK